MPHHTPTRKPIAIYVCHGMGRQVPFETLNEVAYAIAGVGSSTKITGHAAYVAVPNDTKSPHPLGRAMVARAEVTITNGTDEQPVHLYEAYWAPLTEGAISLRDTVGFLLKAALLGLRYGYGKFKRQAFGDLQEYSVERLTWAKVGAILITVLAVILIGCTFTAVVAADIARVLGFPYKPDLITFMRKEVAWLGVPLFVVLLWISLGTALQALVGRISRPNIHETLSYVVQGLFTWIGITVGVVLLTTVAVRLIMGTAAYLACSTPDCSMLSPLAGGSDPFRGATSYGWFVFVVGVTVLSVRYFLIQFLGDVAVYLSSHTVNRFFAIREAIQHECFEVAKAVYEQKGPDDGHVYDTIIVASHSLGSVIAYDTLNALLRWDRAVAEGGLRVAERTRLFLTCGSPLDKVAFFFRFQTGGVLGWIKEQYSAFREYRSEAQQPMIVGYDRTAARKHRPQFWVNIYSPPDWFSGRLEYYDDPDRANGDLQRVCNIEDTHSYVPLVAHVQYWQHSPARSVLRAAISGEDSLRQWVTQWCSAAEPVRLRKNPT